MLSLLWIWHAAVSYYKYRSRAPSVFLPPTGYSQLQSPLFRLPYELREEIYVLVIAGQPGKPAVLSPEVASLKMFGMLPTPWQTQMHEWTDCWNE